MKLHQNKDKLESPLSSLALYSVCFLFVGLTSISSYLIYQLYNIVNQANLVESSRYTMTQKADELRQSSDDLTRLARQYVVSGNQQNLTDYYHVLAIRNGEAPRPKDYQHIYWDLSPAQRRQWHPGMEAEALKEAILSLPFTESERVLLAKSERSSNSLVSLEVQAFNAMQGVFMDDKGAYTLRDEPNTRLATQLLYSDHYTMAKARIMLPLDRFMVIVTKRLQDTIRRLKEKEKEIVSALPILLLSNLIIFLVTIRLAHKKLDVFHQQLKLASLTDSLTGIPNRRYMDVNGQSLISLQQRYGKPLAALMIDIDLFKKVNDRYGHPAGDAVIRQVASLLSANARESDILARMGGEEFAILLPECSMQDAASFADRVCKLVGRRSCLYQGNVIEYTISVGMSVLHEGQKLEDILGHADTALYKAKSAGRNRVCIESDLNHFELPSMNFS